MRREVGRRWGWGWGGRGDEVADGSGDQRRQQRLERNRGLGKRSSLWAAPRGFTRESGLGLDLGSASTSSTVRVVDGGGGARLGGGGGGSRSERGR